MKITLRFLTGIFLYFIFLVPVCAQTFEWVRSQGLTNNGVHGQTTIATDQAGNVLMAGLTNVKANFGSGLGSGGDVLLQQFSRAGSLLFSHSLTGKVQVQSITYSPNGDFYLVGRFKDSARFDAQHVLYNSNTDILPFLAKYSAAGAVLWVKNMRTQYPTLRHISAITTDQAGNLYAACNNTIWHSTHIRKFDPSGGQLLNIDQVSVRNISSVAVDQRGNIYAAGSCVETGALFGGQNFGTGFSYDMYLASYTASGSSRWVKMIQDGSCYHPELKADQDGHLYMAGILTGKRTLTFGNVTAQGNALIYDFFLTRVDTSGTFKWVREVPQVTTGDAGIGFHSDKHSSNCLAVDAGNNVYLAGRMRNTINWGNNIINTAGTSDDLLLQKYDAAGNLQWSKSVGGTGADRGSSVAVNTFGDVFVAGTAQGTITLDTIQHSNSGLIYPFLAKINTSLNTTTGIKPEPVAKTMVVFPNPAGQVAIIKLPVAVPGSIRVYNTTGQLVTQIPISGNQQEVPIDLNGLPSGIYYIQLPVHGKLYQQKLVKL